MNLSLGKNTRKNLQLGWHTVLTGLLLMVILTACGGGGSSQSSSGNTGSVAVGLTDAQGDFLTYTVDVTSIKLVHSNGNVVETLPLTTTVDFAQYTDMTEFVTARTIPLGDYKEAYMTLDFRNAEIKVEGPNGDPVDVTQILDAKTNQSIDTMEVQVQLDRNVPVAPGLARYVMFDFNLAQSNTVIFNSDGTATIKVEPMLTATVDKEPAKLHRLRGPLKSVNVDGGYYDVYIRPYFRRIQRNTDSYGEFHVYTSDTTVFEIDGVTYSGKDGLTVLSNLPQYTAVVAIGHLHLNPLRFDADEVHAGSSVPGGDMDVVKGSVTARTGTTLSLRGVTMIRSDGTVVFNDKVTVTVDTSTIVTKELAVGLHHISEISVGQRITAFGTVTNNATDNLQFSADNGYVRMELSQVRGHVTAVPAATGEYLTLNLSAINGRNPAIYQLSDTMATADQYQLDTGTLDLTGMAPDDDVAARGFPTPFGNNPPDFTAQTLVQYPLAQ